MDCVCWTRNGLDPAFGRTVIIALGRGVQPTLTKNKNVKATNNLFDIIGSLSWVNVVKYTKGVQVDRRQSHISYKMSLKEERSCPRKIFCERLPGAVTLQMTWGLPRFWCTGVEPHRAEYLSCEGNGTLSRPFAKPSPQPGRSYP